MSIFDNEFEEFFDNAIFGKPVNIKWSTPHTKDLTPYYWSKWVEKDKELGFKCVCRTVGVDEKDIKITLEDDCKVVIDGKTEYEGTTYTQHIELPINKDVYSRIETIEYKSVNGLTYVYLRLKAPEKPKILINKVNK